MHEDGRASVPGVVAAASRVAMTPPVLTRRQYEVLRLAALGMDYRAIALELGVSPQTAKNHAQMIYLKAGAHCLADALRWIGWLKVP